MKTVTPIKGGKRPGAGRKPGEVSVVIRVPVGILPDVQALIERYKAGRRNQPLKSVTVIDDGQMDWTETVSKKGKDGPLKAVSEINGKGKSVPASVDVGKSAPVSMEVGNARVTFGNGNSSTAIGFRLSSLQAAPRWARRKVLKQYGGLDQAARAGVYYDRSGVRVAILDVHP